MIKFLYAPPFAGSNFLAKHLLWDNNPPKNSWYKEEDNEYQIDREIADKVSNTGREMAFMFLIGKKDIFEKIVTDNNIIEEHNTKIILEYFYELPFYDFIMFSHKAMNLKDPWITNFFKQCMKLFIKTYKDENLKCRRVTHFHFSRYIPDFEYGDYCSHLNLELDDKAKDLCAKLSGLKSFKHSNFNPDAVQCNATINNVPNTISYSKMFFDLDANEIYKAFDYFDNTLYFENNKDLIIEDFENYTKKNFELIK